MKKLITHLFFAIVLCLLSINSYAQVGSNDSTFNPGSGADNHIITTALQSDGKILIGGGFTNYNGTVKKFIARLNSDGTLDATFNPTGTGPSSTVTIIAVQSDGKILIGGEFYSYNGTSKNHIARLNTDGSLDANFTGTGTNDIVSAIATQSDGKILIGGSFKSYNDTIRHGLARLHANGGLDTNFKVARGVNQGTTGSVSAIVIQSDGKILIGGTFASYNLMGKSNIARVNTDGSEDGFFLGAGTNNTIVNAIAIQSDGKILIGGDFTNYDGLFKNKIARLKTNGNLDASFTGPGANDDVHTIAIQSDGKILIGGDFSSYNGKTRNRIARLNTDGALDADFTGTGTNNTIHSIALQSDGKILIGGGFKSYNDVDRNYVARINNASGNGIIDNAPQNANGLSVFPNPSNGAFTIQLNKEETFTLYNSLGQIVRTIQLNQATGNSVTISGLEPGIYFLKGQSNTLLNYKIVVE